MVNFGNKLRILRKEAGMTQTELARRQNITKSFASYSELQERTPSPDLLIKFAAIFYAIANYLLGIEHKKMIDVSDLTDEDMRFMLVTIETLPKKNNR